MFSAANTRATCSTFQERQLSVARCGYDEANAAYERADAQRDHPLPLRSLVTRQRETDEADAARAAADEAAKCEHDQLDLIAQWQAATATRNAVIVANNQRLWSMGEFVLLFGAFVAALYAAIQSQRSADIAEREFIEGNRPEFRPNLEEIQGLRDALSLDAGGNPHVSFNPENMGGRTAHILGCGARFYLLEGDDPPKPSAEIFGLKLNGRTSVPAGGTFPLWTEYASWSKEDVAAIDAVTKIIFVVGIIVWTDRSNIQWETGFTYWFRRMTMVNSETGKRRIGGYLSLFESAAHNFERPRKAADDERT